MSTASIEVALVRRASEIMDGVASPPCRPLPRSLTGSRSSAAAHAYRRPAAPRTTRHAGGSSVASPWSCHCRPRAGAHGPRRPLLRDAPRAHGTGGPTSARRGPSRLSGCPCDRELRRRLSWAARRPRRPRGHPRRPRFEQSAARGYAGQEDQRAYFERKQPTAPTSADLPDVPKIVLILSRFLRFSGHRHVEWLVGGSSARCTRYHQYLAFLPPQDRVGGHWG